MEESAPVTPPHVVSPFRLHPFHGVMLSPSGVGDPASARLFARPFREVPGRLSQWTGSGRVRWDAEPAVYLHEYTSGGMTVRGLVGALDLTRTSSSDDDRSQAVFPHEGVHPEQVSALAERMSDMRINPAPILLVHRGPSALRDHLQTRLGHEPDLAFTDRNDQVQRLWAIREPDDLAFLDTVLGPSRALIADGHHRYAAYLRLATRHPGTPWTRGLAMLVDQSDTPLWLGAIHRYLAGRRLPDLVEQLATAPDVVVRPHPRAEALERLGPHTLVLTDDRDWAVVDLLDRSLLAVTAFEAVVLDRLGIPRPSVSFHHSVEATLSQARHRDGVAVLMPSPPFDEVMASAVTGRLLPEKATSFQPKPSLGVLMRNLTDE